MNCPIFLISGWQRNSTELTGHKTFVQSILETEKERLSSTLISLLNEITETVTADDYSRCHLLKILYVSQFRDFSLLSRAAINNRKPVQGNECVHSSVESRTLDKYNENGDNNATVENNANTVNNDQTSLLDNRNKTVTTNVSKPALTYEQYQSVARKRRMEELMQIMSDKLHFYGGPRRSIFHSKIKPTLPFDLDTFLKNYDFSFEMYRDSSRKSFDGKVNKAHSEIRRRNPGAARTVKSLLRQRAREKQPQLEYEKVNEGSL